MINVELRYLDIVKKILSKFFSECEIRVFGSRITDNFKPYSDLDIAIVSDEKIDIKIMFRAKEAFQESDLPMRVDLLDWNAIDESFQNIIVKRYEIINLNDNNKKI